MTRIIGGGGGGGGGTPVLGKEQSVGIDSEGTDLRAEKKPAIVAVGDVGEAPDRTLIEGPQGEAIVVASETSQEQKVQAIVPATVSDAEIDALVAEFEALPDEAVRQVGARVQGSLREMAGKVREAFGRIGTSQLAADAGRYFGEGLHLAHAHGPLLMNLGMAGLAVATLFDVVQLAKAFRDGATSDHKLLALARVGVDVAVLLSPLVILCTAASLIITATEYAAKTDDGHGH